MTHDELADRIRRAHKLIKGAAKEEKAPPEALEILNLVFDVVAEVALDIKRIANR